VHQKTIQEWWGEATWSGRICGEQETIGSGRFSRSACLFVGLGNCVSGVNTLKAASMPVDDAVMSATYFIECRDNRNQRGTYNAHSVFRGQLCLLDEQMSLAVQEDSKLTRIHSFRALQYISRLSPRPGTRVLWRGRTAPLCDGNGGLAHQFLDLVPLVIAIVKSTYYTHDQICNPNFCTLVPLSGSAVVTMCREANDLHR